MRKYRPPNYKPFLIIMSSILLLTAAAILVSGWISGSRQPVSRTLPYTTAQARLSATATPAPVYQYIGNRRSHVYHRPSCPSVRQMNAGNKTYLKDKAEAKLKDYTPCGRCHP